MDEGVVGVLACPRCKGGLTQRRDGLTCERCSATYPVRDGSAVFLTSSVTTPPAPRLTDSPRLYDMVQRLAGVAVVERHLRALLQDLGDPPRVVLDMAGGTGLARALFPEGAGYVCLDSDPHKLRACLANNPGALTVLADCTNAPIASGSVELVLCRFVAHHLEDAALDRMLQESARVLRDDGRLVLVDPVWRPRRPAGRLLWAIDRGSHPRREAQLESSIGKHFTLEAQRRFSVFHAYAAYAATPLRQFRA